MRTIATLRGAFLAGLTLVLACTEQCGCESVQEEAALGPAAATYRTRGKVTHVPADATQQMIVHHEAIPDFQDQSGEKVGMHSMSMRFAVNPEVVPQGLSKDAPIAFDFEVRWDGDVPLRIVKIEALPKDTALELMKMPSM